ncbi:MAG: SIS domain-containing protein [Patescibacteria group bacterium]
MHEPGESVLKRASAGIIGDLIARRPELVSCREAIERAAYVLARAFARGGKLLACGNGGSAADAEHVAGELMKSFRLPRPLPPDLQGRLAQAGDPSLARRLQIALPAVALAGASPLSTAIANDLGAEYCFAQQIMGLGRPGDVFLGISTSGNARNVLAAARTARALGLRTLGLTGRAGGLLAGLVEVSIMVPADETFIVQELHQPVYHALCAAVEEEIFGPAGTA